MTELGEIAVDEGVVVTGRVVDAQGRAVADATVEALILGDESDPKTTTDDSGAFRLARCPKGEVDLAVAATGFLADLVLHAPAPNASPLVVALRRGGLLACRVTDRAGKFANQRLQFEAEGPLSTGAEARRERQWVDERREVSVRLVPGRYRVTILDDADAVLAAKDVDLREDETAPAEFALGE
jgi:hypothetical protein